MSAKLPVACNPGVLLPFPTISLEKLAIGVSCLSGVSTKDFGAAAVYVFSHLQRDYAQQPCTSAGSL